MKKKSVKKASRKNKTKVKSSKRKFFYIQAALTLLIAGYLILSGVTKDKTMTGNVVSNSGGASANVSFNIFLIVGTGLAFFAAIEMIILFITAYVG